MTVCRCSFMNSMKAFSGFLMWIRFFSWVDFMSLPALVFPLMFSFLQKTEMALMLKAARKKTTYPSAQYLVYGCGLLQCTLLDYFGPHFFHEEHKRVQGFLNMISFLTGGWRRFLNMIAPIMWPVGAELRVLPRTERRRHSQPSYSDHKWYIFALTVSSAIHATVKTMIVIDGKYPDGKENTDNSINEFELKQIAEIVLCSLTSLPFSKYARLSVLCQSHSQYILDGFTITKTCLDRCYTHRI